MMLYPKNKNKFDEAVFKDPPSEYRCTPFWAWNCELDRDALLKEIDFMKEMGMGGFHIHSRAGMSTRYLSEDFMGLVKACNEKAKEQDMLCWLYDEDKWPSGFAGGYVTKDPKHRQKRLVFTPDAISAEGSDSKAPSLIAKYDVTLDACGKLVSYRRLDPSERGENVWYAYIDTAKESPWHNFQTYVDTLSKPAIEEFVKITHEKYKETVGDEFGKSVPAIFTDEPQVTHKKCLDFATQRANVILPYTPDFNDTYIATYGEDFLDKLPEVIWELPSGVSQTRYRYHDHTAERFISAFCDTIGDWCRANGLYATGHMMEEPTLKSQTVAIGEAMRAYRSLTLPGVDMLCDSREFTTVKQAASAAHQYGAPGVMSELYGVTNWNFDFRGHKLQGDWQAALGVSVRVPHLYWVSMRGDAKRDYPASIGHQSAWYTEYKYIEDHFARVNTLMTRGKPRVRIGVIHPIESYWLHYGPNDSTLGIRSEMDKRFSEITEWLLGDTLDFDFVCESLLKDQFVSTEKGFRVGEMTYDAIVVPGCETLRSTTVSALSEFASKNGKIIFMGDAPTLVDGAPSELPGALAKKCQNIAWSRYQLASALEPYRTLKIQKPDGSDAQGLIYGMRTEEEQKYLFICHAFDAQRDRVPEKESYIITVNGEYIPTLMDTETGDSRPLAAKYKNGNTLIDWDCYSQSSLLLILTPGVSDVSPATADMGGELTYLKGECEVILHEPNVCVLDMAKWNIDGGQWHEPAESILICKMAKEELGLSTASIGGAQPWAFDAPVAKNTVTLEYTFESEIRVENCELALENFENTEIFFNGKRLDKKISGYYVDFSIKKTPLDAVLVGKNTVTVSFPISAVSNIENMFILGDFSVKLNGDKPTVSSPVRRVGYGDLASRGFPFYGGAVTYRKEIDVQGCSSLSLGVFSAPAVTVSIDGKRIANASLAPHTADLSGISEGKHTLDITVYLSRINTFGSFHNSNRHVTWHGPNEWYPSPNDYSFEYKLDKTGLLTAPRLYKRK